MEKMDLVQMVVDKIRREGIDQGIAAEQISQYEPMSRTTLNRFIKHEKILNARHVIAMAKWVGIRDRERQIQLLQMKEFLDPLGEEGQERLTLEYRLDAIHEELARIGTIEKGKTAPIYKQPLPAGAMRWAHEEIAGYMVLPPKALPAGRSVVASIKGDCLAGHGLNDGDYIVIALDKEPQVGDVVVARIGDEVTVKEYHPLDDIVELRPAGGDYETIQCNADELDIIGVVVKTLKDLE